MINERPSLAHLVIVLAIGCQGGASKATRGSASQPAAGSASVADAGAVILDEKARRAKEAADFKAAADAAARKLEAAPPAQADDRPPPPAAPGRVWHEPLGVSPCVRGGTVAACEKAFGRATPVKDVAGYFSWPNQGVEIATEKGHIVSLWVHFVEEGFEPFAGTGDHWLDGKATVEDVLRWYGPPESAYDYPKDGIRETSLLYFKRGLYFDFKAGLLVQIAFVTPPAK